MANNKKQSNTSLILIWVLIILLAAGTFGIINYYNSTHSTLLANDELASALSASFEKPIGKITQEDLNGIEGVTFYEDLSYYEGIPAVTGIEYYLDGYQAAYDAYYAEDVTEEEKATLVDPSTLLGYVELTDKNVIDDIVNFKELTTLSVYNYGETASDTDMLKYAAENLPMLESLTVYGYTTADFSLVGNLSNLTSLSYISDDVTDISPVSKLSKLETLAVSGSGIADISAISSLTALETLSVSGTSVSDISAVSALTNLKVLDLSSNKITDISALSALNNDVIEEVYITGNEITDYTPVKHIDSEKVFSDEVTEEPTEESTEGAEDSTEVTEDNSEVAE